ncbi:hypothetical protein MNBD_GAMMA12-1506 [hydrothermal vent metagenome]|uniref:Protein-S-isoprenylcysteine methyltransferase n=1 Tax=hydrothermal vent metagenome TaxID=652676 RepID=A0A3B0YPD7_9ZZZZ
MKLKIPPPVLAVLLIFAMWGLTKVSGLTSVSVLTYIPSLISWLLIGLALSIDIWALSSFRSAKTTINPMKPQNASQLVIAGIYKYTRNPMYLGLFIILTAFILWFGIFINFLFLFVFVFYMNKFQIMPEESALLELFGDDYAQYKSNVRRWI